MIAVNEIENLKRSLPSLSFCDEIVIVDSGSTDGSIEYARSLGCKVYQRDFDRFGSQKSFAVSLATNDWVFNLDADEWVAPALARELKTLIESETLNGIWIRSRLVFLNRIFRFGRESRVRVLRVFRKSAGDFDRASVHEKVVIRNPAETTTRHHILHHSYPNLELYLQKMNRYTTLGATANARMSSVGARVHALLFPVRFLQFYVQQLNFLNGWEGFCWSLLSTHAYFIKYVKISLLKRTAETRAE